MGRLRRGQAIGRCGHQVTGLVRYDYRHGLGDARTPDDLFSMTGVGPFSHAEASDRPLNIFGGKHRLHFKPG